MKNIQLNCFIWKIHSDRQSSKSFSVAFHISINQPLIYFTLVVIVVVACCKINLVKLKDKRGNSVDLVIHNPLAINHIPLVTNHIIPLVTDHIPQVTIHTPLVINHKDFGAIRIQNHLHFIVRSRRLLIKHKHLAELVTNHINHLVIDQAFRMVMELDCLEQVFKLDYQVEQVSHSFKGLLTFYSRQLATKA